MKRLTVLAALLALLPVRAQVVLPPLFSDHMVLQHSSPVKVWGTAAAGARVRATWRPEGRQGASRTLSATADASGRWAFTLPTPGPGGPYSLTVSDGTAECAFHDILCGDVWLCGGQSNMEMRLADKVLGWEEELARASSREDIRLLRVLNAVAAKPTDDIQLAGDGWQRPDSACLAPFSAAAWYFARKITAETGIPIGLVESCRGGTLIESWTSGRTLAPIGRFAAMIDEMARLPESREERRALYDKQVAAWEKEMARIDYAYKDGVPVWALPGAPEEGWSRCSVPGYLQFQGLKGYHGYFWMRRDVTIPSEWEGKDLELCLGTVDDDDCTYFNGTFVGHTELCIYPRRYTVPGALVHPGCATIAVRVRDTGGLSGIMGNEGNLLLRGPDGRALSLTGPWLCRETVDPSRVPLFPIDLDNNYNGPSTLFNAMIWPLRDMRIRGAIWYQGESNSDAPEDYKVYLPAMIRDWRQTWGYDFPFYIAQICNYGKRKEDPEESGWAGIREAQLQTARSVAGTGLAVLIDVGEEYDIHPKDKRSVGERLALPALHDVYGKHLVYSGPLYEDYTIEGAAVRIRFAFPEGLHTSDGGPLKGFWMAGPDRTFQKADAVIDGQSIVVTCPGITNPVAVRYAWGANPACNLVGSTGLPASPFRTDTWPLHAE